MEVIHFYHTNDLHSQFEKWPRINRFIKNKRTEHERNSETVFVLDIGDHVDRVHPYTEATFGQSNIQLLNDVQVDMATIGNNEGITMPFEALDQLYKDAQFEVLISNLYYPNKERPKWLKPYTIHETKHGTKIGFIGLTVFFSKFYQELGWHLTEPLEELEKQISEIRSDVDILVLLSHLGINEDEEIARRFPDIDIIIGGHTHHILEQGKLVNQTLLACAGKHGNFVGHVEMVWDGYTVTSKTAELFDSDQLPAQTEDVKWVKDWRERGEDLLREEVVQLPYILKSNWEKETKLSQLLAEGIREWCDAEASILNCGLFLKDLEKGPVTKLDIHQLLPHPINPCIVWLDGQELLEVVKQALEEKWMDWILKGLGFRGKVMGVFLFDRITVQEDSSTRKILLNNEPIDSNRIYKIATIDMFTFGHFFPEIYRAEKKDFDMAHMIRDVMEWKLKQTFS